MPKLNLSTVELISTLRKAPLNGAPSSDDFNDGEREKLADLSTVVSFLNDTVLQLLNSLPSTALLPPGSPVGLEGRTLYTDSSDTSSLFFDPLATTSLTVADSMRLLNGMVTTQRNVLTDMQIEVATLQARLSSTSQNDIALALQNFSDSLNSVVNTLGSHGTQLVALQNAPVVNKGQRVTTGSIGPGATESIPLTWTVPFLDNLYTVTPTCEDITGALTVLNWTFQVGGVGVIVRVKNNDVNIAHTGILHVLAKHDD